ncbi:hypothetical protein FWK35_00000322 [Aphis craccivora]|uniref:Uncharacterized protein n=1 Tax=Aphis craccivora TaxID=307492 RepID=A0A6G0ZRM4_APHCR|nr:hypothetical protein FWK35_00000322 [Aphis craccivora]
MVVNLEQITVNT